MRDHVAGESGEERGQRHAVAPEHEREHGDQHDRDCGAQLHHRFGGNAEAVGKIVHPPKRRYWKCLAPLDSAAIPRL